MTEYVQKNMSNRGRKQGKYSQAARVLRLVDHLAARRYGATLQDLAAEFQVTERQIRRDLSAIEEGGYFIERSPVRGRTGVRLMEGRPGAVRLTLRERFTLLAIRRVFDVLGGTPFSEDVRSIYDKIIASLPKHAQERAALPEGSFVYLPDGGTKPYSDKADVLDALLTGVIHRCRVRCRYRSVTGARRRGELRPYALVLYRHGLYVVGRLTTASEPEPKIKTFAVERFSKAEFLKGTSFERPEDFNVDAYFEGAFGLFTGTGRERVVLEFEPEVAQLLRDRIWHPSQKLRRLPGGRTRLTLDVANTTQLVQWLVGWGPMVRTISPTSVRDWVRDEHERAIALD